MLRTVATVVTAGLLLAACTAGADPEPTASTASATPSPSITATATATATANPEPQPTSTTDPTSTADPSPEPSETSTVAPETEPTETITAQSDLMSATVPARWEECQDAESRASSIALDVLGAWAAAGDCATGTVLVIEAVPVPQGGITSQVYFDQVMVPRAQEEGDTLSSERFTAADGREGLVARGGSSAQFVIAAGELVVLGTLDGPEVNNETVGRMREVARTLSVG